MQFLTDCGTDDTGTRFDDLHLMGRVTITEQHTAQQANETYAIVGLLAGIAISHCVLVGNTSFILDPAPVQNVRANMQLQWRHYITFQPFAAL